MKKENVGFLSEFANWGFLSVGYFVGGGFCQWGFCRRGFCHVGVLSWIHKVRANIIAKTRL